MSAKSVTLGQSCVDQAPEISAKFGGYKLSVVIAVINNTDQELTLLVNGVRYVYQFRDAFPLIVDKAQAFLSHGAAKQALDLVKARAVSYKKL